MSYKPIKYLNEELTKLKEKSLIRLIVIKILNIYGDRHIILRQLCTLLETFMPFFRTTVEHNFFFFLNWGFGALFLFPDMVSGNLDIGKNV